jgi:hypothetical protein
MTALGGPNTAQAFSPSLLKIYIAPLGTTMPADATTAMASTYFDFGYFAEDGQAFNEDRTVAQTFAWSGELVKETVTRRVYTITGNLLQQNSQLLQAAYGGGSVAVTGGLATFTPPSGRANTPFACVLEWVDGSNAHRILVPKVTSGTGASRPFAQGVITTPISLSITATIGVPPFTEITNDVTNFPVLT